MGLSDKILEECSKHIALSEHEIGLLKTDQNRLPIADRERLQSQLQAHLENIRDVIKQVYSASHRKDVDNIKTWAATVVAESNQRGYLTEFDQLLLTILNDPQFDGAEASRVLKRFMFSNEWPVVARGVGVVLLSLMIWRMWGFPQAIFLSAVVMLAALVATFFFYSEDAAKPLGLLFGRLSQLVVGVFFVGLEALHYKDVSSAVFLGIGYAILFFAHGFGIPLMEKLAVRLEKTPSSPFRG